MANEIKIRAKKISDLNQDANFDFETKGGETFLIVAYKPTAATGGTAQNFRISIKSIIDKLKESISGMSNDEFKNQLIAVLKQYDEVQNILVTKSVLDWARDHGFEGSDAELWQLFQNGSGGNTPTDPEEPEIKLQDPGFSWSTSSFTYTGSESMPRFNNPKSVSGIVFTSDNTEVATVSSNGTITIKPVTRGAATITATKNTDDTYIQKTVSVNISVNINVDTTSYLFTYASELQEGIFTKDVNDTIIDVNVDALKALSYTQEVVGKVPTTNKNGHGFCLQDWSVTYAESYVWDGAVADGRVWIILPAKFYNISQKNFIDEKGGKWKFLDALMKNPMSPAVDPITITGLYNNTDYVLVCFSEAGNTDEQFFKKIG